MKGEADADVTLLENPFMIIFSFIWLKFFLAKVVADFWLTFGAWIPKADKWLTFG